MSRYFIYLISTICFIPSCRNETKEEKGTNRVNDFILVAKTDTFSSGKLADVADMLGIPSLGNLNDSIQIRIWMPCGRGYGDTQNVILFHNRGGKWYSKFLYFTAEVDDSLNLKSIKNEIVIKEPKSGWKKFSKMLINTEIETLPNYKTLKEYYLPTDPTAITVEISKKGFYRYYKYPEFEMNRHIKEGPGKLETALQLIEAEFDYTRKCN